MAFLLPTRLSSTTKTVSMPWTGELVELRDHLGRGLEPRAPPEDHDDVAELAGERAAARELDVAEGIAIHFQEVEPRHRNSRHIGALGLLVAPLPGAGVPIGEELRPGFLRFADESANSPKSSSQTVIQGPPTTVKQP